jgi:hypothetical protein
MTTASLKFSGSRVDAIVGQIVARGQATTKRCKAVIEAKTRNSA